MKRPEPANNEAQLSALLARSVELCGLLQGIAKREAGAFEPCARRRALCATANKAVFQRSSRRERAGLRRALLRLASDAEAALKRGLLPEGLYRDEFKGLGRTPAMASLLKLAKQRGLMDVPTQHGWAFISCLQSARENVGCRRIEPKPKVDARPAKPVALADGPEAIRARLDALAVGQEGVKSALASVGYRHLRRLAGESELPRSAVLLAGPSGTGKTLLARGLADCLDIPFMEVSAASLTKEGYTGQSVADFITRMVKESGPERARTQILFIDEVDKLAASGGPKEGRDIIGEVQNELLMVIAGTKVALAGRGPDRPPVSDFDTGGLLVILAGAFTGHEELVAQRKKERRSLGFGAAAEAKSAVASLADADTLRAWGLKDELIGRIGLVACTQPLSCDELEQIVARPGSGLIHPYTRLAQGQGLTLTYSEPFIKALAKQAKEKGLGARGLSHTLESLVTPVLDRRYKGQARLLLDAGEDLDPCAVVMSGDAS